MKFQRLLSLALALDALQGSAQTVQAARSDSLAEIVRIASVLKIPLGIVRGHGDELCKVQSPNLGRVSDDTEDTIKSIASGAGYRSLQDGEVLVIVPAEIPTRLQTVIATKLDSFPSLTGSLHYMGLVLQGWVASTFNGAKGYAISNAEGGRTEKYNLPKVSTSTATQIADRIITLGPKGMWVLGESLNLVTRDKEAKIAVLSYDKNAQEISELTCVSEK